MPKDLAAPAADTADLTGNTPGRSDRSAQRRHRRLRLAVLITGLVGITALGFAHQASPNGLRTVGVDALCPFGGLESLWAVISAGSLLQRVAASSIVLLAFTVVTALVLRRVFCGYLCPLGALQELFGKLGARLWGRRRRPQVPPAIDRPARYLKYAVLAVVALWTWSAGELVIRPYDPWVAYMHLSSAEVFAEFSLGLVVLGVSVAGSIVYDRFFCKYLCPMGALLAIFSKVAPFAVRRNTETCTACGACDRACPASLKVSSVESVTSAECLSCNECVNACPVNDTLQVRRVGTARSLTPARVLAITLIALATTVVVATATDNFSWTLPEQPTVAAGAVDPETIKGYMTFEQVSQATGIPANEFERRFGIASADMTKPMKDLSAAYGFDVHTDVRDFIAERVAAGTTQAGDEVVPAGGEGAAGEAEN